MNDALVTQALRHFGINYTQITPIKTSNNAVYQVNTTNATYALRIHKQSKRKLEWIETELTWLKALRQETDLLIPKPIAPVCTLNSDGTSIYCTLLEWIEGSQLLPSDTTPDHARQIGTFIAHLHNHSTRFSPPPNFTLPRLDWEGMFGSNVTISINRHDDLFTPEQHSILNQIGERVREIMATLDKEPDQFGIIHADLIWKNILFNGEKVGAIDFDECAYGYYLYDLAPTLLGYMDEPNYPEIRAAIWDRYTSIRPLPASFNQHLETLVAGRYALSCYWIAANRHIPAIGERASEIITFRTEQLRRYLETGKLRRGEIII